MSKTLVVVPTYNERDNLPPLVQRLMALPVKVQTLVVDDNSPDGTGKIADELAAKNGAIHVLHRTEKSGLGRAYIAGFKWALEHGFDFIFELDGDFSHNPDDIPMFLEAAQQADLVLGSRYKNGIRVINWPLSRLMLSKSAAKYVKLITGMPFTDPTGGYKCFRRRALEALNLDDIRSNGYSFQIETTHRLWRRGMRIVEVPIVFTDRFQGHSKMSGHIVREALLMVWRLFFQNNMRRTPRPSKLESIREFGTAVPGQTYVLRLGSYSIARQADRVAIVLAPGGAYLPGGAQQPGESPEQAAVREALEECGLRIQLGRCIGVADELVYADKEQTYFRKRCTFFTAEVMDFDSSRAIEPDHQLVWLPPAEALAKLRHESQRWALQEAERIRASRPSGRH